MSDRLGMKSKLILLAMLLLPTVGRSQETIVQTLSEGACWFEQSESLKLVSFNEHEAITLPREGLEEGLMGMIEKSRKESVDLYLHCGGQGLSIVAKSSDTCAWFKLEKGQFDIRSVGGLEPQEKSQTLCDGYKLGELIVGVHAETENLFTGLQAYIKKHTRVSGKVFKVELNENFRGKEAELIKELKAKDKNIRYVELNQYQHSVGEYTQLK